MRTRAASMLLVAAALLTWVACGTDTRPTVAEATATAESTATAKSTPTSESPDIIREEMGSTDPSNAPGETLYMTRVRFTPGYRIATHTHPGTQLAFVEKGTLTYTVVRGGSVPVHDPDGEIRHLGPGETTQLPSGSWIVENEGVVHYGRNDTDGEVVLLTSAILEKGEPISTPVT